MTVEERYKNASPLQRVLGITGCVCFICIFVAVMIHLGFQPSTSHSPAKPFLTTETLLLLNIGLGIVGGILLNYKRYIIAGISGLIASLGLTGFSFLYMGWRESIESFEFIIILFIGILPGVFLYNVLMKRYPDK